MPQTTQYIREEDMEAWSAIENKSKWIHDHLNKVKAPIMKVPVNAEISESFVITDKLKQLVTINNPLTSGSFARPTTGTCKLHGTLLDVNGKCTQKGHKK